MNQILFIENNPVEEIFEQSHSNTKKNKTFFKFQLIFCSIVSIIVSIYYIYSLYNNNKQENISRKLVDNFYITSIYTNNDYTATRTVNFYETHDKNFTVIGLIEINSININYPILSTINNDLLKIAPCRFYGPMPNEVGNLCIAGHNYNNYKFFSKLKKLQNGDVINIYDLSGNKVQYEVYSSYEIDYNDLSCTTQDTNEKKEVTLITCNNIKNKRRVIKAQEKR